MVKTISIVVKNAVTCLDSKPNYSLSSLISRTKKMNKIMYDINVIKARLAWTHVRKSYAPSMKVDFEN